MRGKNGYTQKRNRKTVTIAVSICAALITGCEHYNAINFVTNTQVGAKVGVNAEKIPEIQVGYNRQEAARVPVYLMQGQKNSSEPSAETTALLTQAARKLGELNSQTQHADKVRIIAVAKRTIETATRVGNQPATGEPTALLGHIRVAALKLTDDDSSESFLADVELVRELIQAELVKSKFYSQIQEQGKFIGTRNENDFHDSYSVLGTFSGSMNSSAVSGAGPQASLNGGIAQYFATGIAAQLLAEKGGAATVSTAPTAKVPSEVDARKEAIQDVANSDTVTDFVWKAVDGNPPQQDTRDSRLAIVFKQMKISDQTRGFYSARSSREEFKRRILNGFDPDELAQMVANINSSARQ